MNKTIKTVRLNYIRKASVCDGPGIRMVIFFQGCNRKCHGCHNPETWDSEKGELWEIDSLIEFVENHAKTKRVTLSGGEPLEQMPATERIISRLRCLNYDIALYTGYELEDVPQRILDGLNYIKVGPYVQSLRTTVKPYVGSENQVVHKLRDWERKYNER